MAPPRSCCYWPYGQGEGFQGQSLLISPRAVTFGAFFRNTPATIMRCGRTFRLARTHPAHARWSSSERLARSGSLVGYTIDTQESEFSEATEAEATEAESKSPPAAASMIQSVLPETNEC